MNKIIDLLFLCVLCVCALNVKAEDQARAKAAKAAKDAAAAAAQQAASAASSKAGQGAAAGAGAAEVRVLKHTTCLFIYFLVA